MALRLIVQPTLPRFLNLELLTQTSKSMGQRLDGKELAQRNIFTGITVLIVGGILLAFFKYLFFGTLP